MDGQEEMTRDEPRALQGIFLSGILLKKTSKPLRDLSEPCSLAFLVWISQLPLQSMWFGRLLWCLTFFAASWHRSNLKIYSSAGFHPRQYRSRFEVMYGCPVSSRN